MVSSNQEDTNSHRKLCMACKQEFPEGETVCPNDGTTLTRLTMEPSIGTTVGDKYEIMSVIGGGAMGLVYKARHTLMKRIVALKMLHPNMVADESTVKRFQKEAEALSCLNHPNILTVFDFGVSKDGHPYLVTDYLEGQTLAEILEKNESMHWQRAVRVFTQVCSALAHAHRHGVVHRDIKPSNIMLVQFEDQDDVVKILDFGIAKVLDSERTDSNQLTRTGEVFGSPLYMSPEQCRGKTLDARSDMYSLGCVIYRSLAGRPALFGQDLVECLYKHVHEEPVPLREAAPNAGIPPQLEQIVFKCLAKEPAARYQTMADLKDELNALLESTPGAIEAGRESSDTPAIASSAPSVVDSNHEDESPTAIQKKVGDDEAGSSASDPATSRSETSNKSVGSDSVAAAFEGVAAKSRAAGLASSSAEGQELAQKNKVLDVLTDKRVVAAIVALALLVVAIPVVSTLLKEEPDIANVKPSASPFEEHMEKGTSEFEAGYFAEAKSQFQLALDEAQKTPEKKANTIQALHHLVAASSESSDYDEAEKYLKELEKQEGIDAKRSTPDSKGAAEVFFDRATLLMLQRSKESRGKAKRLLSAALSYYDIHEGNELEKMRTLAKLGQLALMSGELDEAAEKTQRALKIAEQNPSINPLEVAMRMDQLGDTYILIANSMKNSSKQYEHAEDLYLKALQLRQSVLHKDDHPALAQSYKRLGVMYFLQGDYQEALSELNKSLDIRKKDNRPLETAEIQRAISYVYLKQHDFAKADAAFQDAIQTARKSGTAGDQQVEKWTNGFQGLKAEESKKGGGK